MPAGFYMYIKYGMCPEGPPGEATWVRISREEKDPERF
jgi:hypothetical protein